MGADAVPQAPEQPGWAVLHLFCRVHHETSDASAIEDVLKGCEASGHQVVTVACLGHKGSLGVMALGPSFERLRLLQSGLERAGCEVASSYVSLTEVSEYAAGLPEATKQARLRPVLPPEGMPAFCFYPMSKRRLGADNWYRLGFEERLELMRGHGAVGRRFHGRVLQLVTGSTGLDDFEWGVTLFARTHDDLKACVYAMRYDEASARFAEFGPFVTGTVGTPSEVLHLLGLG
ncbi:MAG TPA: chlorite dismutase family protein [Acidimicrobiales bacterium]|nr:chlorite dismutase family protein [Acidimicrobiales bacterium]